jgi:aryl-alcohol dehydrogenase-like predicted oxidoreductase
MQLGLVQVVMGIAMRASSFHQPRVMQYLLHHQMKLPQIVTSNMNLCHRFPTSPIQPVPSQFTKGIFVYSTLYDQLVVGPTEKDQTSRTYNNNRLQRGKRFDISASPVLGPNW